MALFEVSPQQADAFWGSRQHHRSFSLSFGENAQFLIVLGQRDITDLEGQHLTDPNTSFIQQHKERPVSDVGGGNRLKDLHDIGIRQWTRFSFGLGDRVQPLHRVRCAKFLSNDPMIERA